MPSGVWRILPAASGPTEPQKLTLRQIMLQDGHSRLISFLADELKLDDEAQPIDRAGGAVTAAIVLKSLDRLYLAGCRPLQGISKHPTVFAAFLVDFSKEPQLRCSRGEDDETPLIVSLTREP